MSRTPARRRRGRAWVVAWVLLLLFSACGLPGRGTVTEVDDNDVPYQLLEGEAAATSSAHPDSPGPVPVLFWTLGEELVPQRTDASCDDPAADLVRKLLTDLSAGPANDEREAGRSTAITPDVDLTLVDLVGSTAEVAVDLETAVRADRLPAAVGQIVLTVTSVPDVESVELVSAGGSVQVPLPDGVLTAGPVTAADYAELVPSRYSNPRDFGCRLR